MRLLETEPLAKDLEEGLGEVYEIIAGYPPSLRLRMGVGAVVSVALSQHLSEQGYDAQAYSSRPNLDIDPNGHQEIVMVNDESGSTIIDATYTGLLEYAGLSANYVTLSGRHKFYPRQKIASFELNGEEKVVQTLSLASQYFMDHYEPVPEIPQVRMEFKGMTDEEIEARLAEFWNPANFERYVPNDHTHDAGQKLAKFIQPQHVKLVA